MKTEFAVVSDIHGNSWALEHVIADIKRRNIASLINLGDNVYGPLDPGGTADRLMALETAMKVYAVRGNQDNAVLPQSKHRSPSPTLDYVRDQLTDEQLHWLEKMPPALVVDGEIFMCHGTPDNDETYLLEKVTRKGVNLRGREEIERFLRNIVHSITLCGHTHIPRTVLLSDNRLVINPGSVGLQAFTDTVPFPHSMQTGGPHARYVVLSKTEEGWNAEHVKISYDWEKAASRARENHRDDWANWILNGRP